MRRGRFVDRSRGERSVRLTVIDINCVSENLEMPGNSVAVTCLA